MRPIGFIIRNNSPFLLAREVLWRTRKLWKQKRFHSQVRKAGGEYRLRSAAYYRPEVSLLSPRASAAIVNIADAICSGQFPFLGYGTPTLGFPPRWNLDFVSGIDWPPVPAEKISIVRHDGSDVKVPWELSRLQHLPVLGKAYRLTGCQQYRIAAIELVSNWIEQNPVGMGVNWTGPMEAALRAMSICFLVNLLSPALENEKHWLQKVEASLGEHLLYVESHIEFSHLFRGNHYLANVVGLLCLSVFLDGPGMEARRDEYARKVQREMLLQTYEDGGNYEASTGYHVLVTQMFTSAFLLMRSTGTSPDPSFLDRLRGMYRWMAALADSEGRLPQVGDCDDGRVELLFDDLYQMDRVPILERNSLKISSLLGLGTALLGGSPSDIAEDAPWYGLGNKPSVIEDPKSLRSSSISLFRNSGVAVARNERAELLFFNLPNGIGGKGSHTHNDKLSIVLRVSGEELLCDSGTCFYTRNAEIRNRFRGTAAHNVVMLDEQEQNTVPTQGNSLFCLGKEAKVSPIEFSEKDGAVMLKSAHFGYQGIGITHSRSLRLELQGLYLNDYIEGTNAHNFRYFLHLPPAWKVQLLESRGSEISFQISGPRSVSVRMHAPVQMNASLEDIPLSKCYGATFLGTRIYLVGAASLPMTLSTQVIWDS
jgi:Heparinase II/III-like protein/Heparinase II/III N-terminus